jgi:hypothetical protein
VVAEWTPALVKVEIGADLWSEVTLGVNGSNLPIQVQRVGDAIVVVMIGQDQGRAGII